MLTPALALLILGFLVLGNALLAAAETALVSSRKGRLRKLAETGRRGAAQALALTEQPVRFLGLVQLWLTLTPMVAGLLAGRLLGPEAAEALAGVRGMGDWVHGAWGRRAAFVAVAVVLTLGMLVIGELIPKRMALAHPERTAVLLGRLMAWLTRAASPVLGLVTGTADGVVRLLGVRQRPAAEAFGDEEVRALVEQGLHAGVFQRAEKEMVEGVLSLDQLKVTAIMTPRPKIVFLNLDDPEETNWRKIVTSGHSYFPVYQNTRDQVVGMVSVKALWAHAAIGIPAPLKNLLVPPLLVGDTMTAIQLLEQFKKAGKHMAVVVDEFGAVEGLVTPIDVFEAIAGDLPETGRHEGPTATRREDGAWVVDATMPLADFKRLVGATASLPQESEAEFKTAGGFVVTQLGRIPAVGDRFDWGGWRVEVGAMDRRRVDRLVLMRTAPGANGGGG